MYLYYTKKEHIQYVSGLLAVINYCSPGGFVHDLISYLNVLFDLAIQAKPSSEI